MRRIRYEDFGAIIALRDPPALVHVDHEFVAGAGLPPSPYAQAPLGHLSAPTEVHLLLTERCPAGCPSCYVAATPHAVERPAADLRAAFDRLADAGVFDVALGGGESMLRDDLFELAAYARQVGLTPNLTTSGIAMTPERARQCRVFGQVNVSLDGLGEVYRDARGYDGAALALSALTMLRDAGVSTGINLVVCRATLPTLVQTIDAAVAAGAGEIELLRFKPSGRARLTYEAQKLREPDQRRFVALLEPLAERHRDVHIKVDCSFVPLLCATGPDPERLAQFGVIGCEAGNVMSAVRGDLSATACSFVEQPLGDVTALLDYWNTHPDLRRWRSWADSAPQPCASCRYRTLCRGGCKVVSNHVNGSLWTADPECPRVVAHARNEPFIEWSRS